MAVRNLLLSIFGSRATVEMDMLEDNDGASVVSQGGPVRAVRHVELHCLYVRRLVEDNLLRVHNHFVVDSFVLVVLVVDDGRNVGWEDLFPARRRRGRSHRSEHFEAHHRGLVVLLIR